MAPKGEPRVLRLVVVFLRFYAGLTQAEFGRAAGVHQGDVSRYEAGQKTPSEETLARMAAAASVPGSLVTHLRRFYTAILSASGDGSSSESVAETLARAVPELVLLAVAPALIETGTDEPAYQTPEEALREAEEIWPALERFPMDQRRRLVGLTLRASRNPVLAQRLREGEG